MRWLVTLLLLALVAAGGGYLLARDRLLAAVGVAPPAVAGPAESLRVLDQYLKPDRLTALRVGPADAPTLQLTRTPAGWAQPGNWPLRASEVTTLLDALAAVRTRFAVTPLDPGTDLAAFGLTPAQKPVEVQATADTGKVLTLRFGRPPADAAVPDFSRPSYLRVDDLPEVVRLAPDLLPLVTRPADVYRRRQLVTDADRVKVGGDGGRVPLLGDAYTAVTVARTDGTPGYTLKRVGPNPAPRRDAARPTGEPAVPADDLAAAWAVEVESGGTGLTADKPTVRDRVDPAKLRAVLAGVPDLWADRFPADPKDTGLDAPARTVTLSRKDGRSLVVQVGSVSRSVTKTDPSPPASPFAPPPPPPKSSTEEYRFARLKDNPLVFELRTDKLADLFADPADLRDDRLARFETADVAELTVAAKGAPPLTIVRKPGNKDAEAEADKQDRWLIGDKPAEAAKVTELLDALSKLEAKKEDRLDTPDAAKLAEQGLVADSTAVTVTARPKAADGDPLPPPRTYKFVVGKDDAAKKKLAVRVDGWDRVNLVDDAVAKLIDRPALAYRGRRLFDAADAKLETVAVQKDETPGFALGGGPKWTITAPVATAADEAKAAQLAGDLSRLEATEFVDDAPKPEDADAKYGLAKPRYTVALGFTGPGAKPVTLEVGKARDGKPEAFARLAGAPGVFAVGKTVVDALDAGAVGLLPLQLWATTPESVTSVAVTRGGEAYTLTQPGDGWKVSGPFAAAASFAEVQPLLTAVATMTATKADALAAEPRHGFDKPAVTLAVTYKDGDKPTTKTLTVGNPTAAGATTRFATAGGPVFVVADAVLTEADKPALTRLTKSVLTLDPATLAKVAVAGPTPDAGVTLVKDKGQWKAEGAAFAVDGPTVQALVETAARPPVARLLGYGPTVEWAKLGLDKPEYTVTLTTAGDKPTTHVLKVGKADAAGERPVRADDGPAAGVLLPRAAAALAKGKLDVADRSLLAFDPATLTAIKRETPEGELTLAQAGLGWEVTAPDKHKADKPTVDALADQLGRLRAGRVAAFDPKDLAPFGLDAPAATFALTAGDKPLTLAVGGPVSDDPADDRYAAAATPGRPVTVGVLPAALANQLLADPLAFRDRALAPRFVDADKLVVKRGDRTATFEKQAGTWKLTAPVAADAEAADLDELVTALGEVRADELVADAPADLGPYGLAEPATMLTLSAGGEDKLTLQVGGAGRDGRRVYARAAGPLVGLLDPGLSDKVRAEFRKRQVFADLDPAKADVVTVSTDRGTFSLRKQGTGWGPEVDAAAVTDFLAAVAGLKAERFAADVDADPRLYGLDTPARVVVVTQRGAAAKTLQLGGPVGGSGGKRVYARVPDRPGVFELSEAATAALTRDRAGFAAKK